MPPLKGRDFGRAFANALMMYGALSKQDEAEQVNLADQKAFTDFFAGREANPLNITDPIMFGKTGKPTGVAVESGLYEKQRISDVALMDRYAMMGITVPNWLKDRAERVLTPAPQRPSQVDVLKQRATMAGDRATITKEKIRAGLSPAEQKIAAFPTLKSSKPTTKTTTEWERSLDELFTIEQTPVDQRTAKQKFRYAHLKSRVSKEGKKENSLIVQGRIIRNIVDAYGEFEWASIVNENPDEAFQIINNWGTYYVGKDWKPVLSADEMAIAINAINLPRTKEEAKSTYGPELPDK